MRIPAHDTAAASSCEPGVTAKYLYQSLFVKAYGRYDCLSELGTVADLAKAMAKSMPDARMLLELRTTPGICFACKLRKFLAQSLYGDLEADGGCGYGGHEEDFEALDKVMREVVCRRCYLPIVGRRGPWVYETLTMLERRESGLQSYVVAGYSIWSIDVLKANVRGHY